MDGKVYCVMDIASLRSNMSVSEDVKINELLRNHCQGSKSFFFSFEKLHLNVCFYLSSFFLHPRMAEDLIETHSVFSHALVSFSIGE